MFHNEVIQSDVNCITIRISDLHRVARKQVPDFRLWDGFEELVPVSIKHFQIKAFAPWRNSR